LVFLLLLLLLLILLSILHFHIEFTSHVTNRQQLEAQLKENEMVLNEMKLLDKDHHTVYKLIGPVLVKQELTESRHNVEKRMEYIQKER
jgi:prefoldin beta subunit